MMEWDIPDEEAYDHRRPLPRAVIHEAPDHSRARPVLHLPQLPLLRCCGGQRNLYHRARASRPYRGAQDYGAAAEQGLLTSTMI